MRVLTASFVIAIASFFALVAQVAADAISPEVMEKSPLAVSAVVFLGTAILLGNYLRLLIEEQRKEMRAEIVELKTENAALREENERLRNDRR